MSRKIDKKYFCKKCIYKDYQKARLFNKIQKSPYFIVRADNFWCRLSDLNQRPSDYKSDALPAELNRQRKAYNICY